jgi:hypothetical protein
MGGFFNEVGALFGGTPNNAQFTASGTNIQQPSTVEQANQLYGQTQAGIAQQQAMANALAGQGQQGMASQSALTQALQQQMAGQGPNPALAQLANATGQNVANQAALMAGQRGAGGNVGLMARQAAQQGANTQQQAVGQSAVLQAQQQLAAQNALQNLASSQVGQQQTGLNALNQATQGAQQNTLSGINAQNNANVAMQSNINAANVGMAQTNANNAAKATSGFLSNIPVVGKLFGADGGLVPNPGHPMYDVANIYYGNHYAMGGQVENVGSPQGNTQSLFIPNTSQVGEKKQEKSPSDGGGIPTEISGSAETLPAALESSGAEAAMMMASKGAMVPGKAKVPGNSYKNDTVPAMLSAGEIVLPRSVTMSKDAPEKAAKFVADVLAKHGIHGDEEKDFKSALKKAISSRKK